MQSNARKKCDDRDIIDEELEENIEIYKIDSRKTYRT